MFLSSLQGSPHSGEFSPPVIGVQPTSITATAATTSVPLSLQSTGISNVIEQQHTVNLVSKYIFNFKYIFLIEIMF